MEKRNVRNGCVPSREGRSVGGIGHAETEMPSYSKRFAPMHTPSPRGKGDDGRVDERRAKDCDGLEPIP